MNKEELDLFITETYGINADYPWIDSPEAVYRHKENKKWFAIILNVEKSKLTKIEEDSKTDKSIFENQIKKKNKKTSKAEAIDVVNLKCPAEVYETIWLEPNIYPAYHMNKKHWISVPLDGTVSDETIIYLLDKSFDATAYKIKKNYNQVDN